MSDSKQTQGLFTDHPPPLSFFISTICIPSLKLPQPIQTATILNRAIHITLPTESHDRASGPQFSPTDNQSITADSEHPRLCVIYAKFLLVFFNLTYSEGHTGTVFSSCFQTQPFLSHSESNNNTALKLPWDASFVIAKLNPQQNSIFLIIV